MLGTSNRERYQGRSYRGQKATGENFSHANLRGMDFSEANLENANFSYADIRGTNFSNANLKGANFSYARAGLQTYWLVCLSFGSLGLSTLSISVLTWALGFVGSLITSDLGSEEIFFISTTFLSLAAFAVIVVLRGIKPSLGAFLSLFVVATILYLAISQTLPEESSNDIIAIIALAVLQFVIFISAVAGVIITALLWSIIFSIMGLRPSTFTALGLMFLLGASFGASRGIEETPENLWWTAFILVFILAAALFLLSIYIGTKAQKEGDKKYALLRLTTKLLLSWYGTCFRSATLMDSVFTGANLIHTNFTSAKLVRTYWKDAVNLDKALTQSTYLENPKIQRLVTTFDTQKKNFDSLNLENVNLREADLQDVSFIGTILNHSNLQSVNLSRAILKKTQLDGTDLTGANLTGACIEDWGITRETKLSEVRCSYVFMRYVEQDDSNRNPLRKPDDWGEEFEDGDFADFIQPISNTLDLYHTQGVDPRAIAIAYERLVENHPDAELEIVSMEKRGQDKFLLRTKTAKTANHSELSAQYFSNYNRLKSLSESQKLLLAEKDSRIRSLEKMVYAALERSTFHIENSQGDFMPGTTNINAGDNASIIGTSSGNGVINFGTISGDVTNAIGQLPDSSETEEPGLKELLTQLQEILETNSELNAEDKAEALEQVGVLAETGEKPQDNSLQKAAKTAMKVLRGTVAALDPTTELVRKCTELLSAIAKLLPFM